MAIRHKTFKRLFSGGMAVLSAAALLAGTGPQVLAAENNQPTAILLNAENADRSGGVPETIPDPAGGADEVLVSREAESIAWTVAVPQAGIYSIRVEYYPLEGRGADFERTLLIDGALPREEGERMLLPRVWGDEKETVVDSRGNEIRPRQTEKPMWRTADLTDPLGYVQGPLTFDLTAGTHTFTLQADSETMALRRMMLIPYTAPADYTAEDFAPVSGFYQRLQGEDVPIRSSGTIYPTSDKGDPTVDPFSHEVQLLNAIGGYQWKDVGEWIEWEITVPESGMYNFGIVAKQNEKRGALSYRRLYVNGEVPYAQAENIPFAYADYYRMYNIPAPDGTAAGIWLEKGVNHIRLEVSLGAAGAAIREVSDAVSALNGLYRQIVMLTSTNPDPLRDYRLTERIPDLAAGLQTQYDRIGAVIAEIESLSGEKAAGTAELDDIQRILEKMIRQPDQIPNLLSQFRDACGTVGNWLVTAREQPLMIDYLEVSSADIGLEKKEVSFWQLLWNDIQAFIQSFLSDYDTLGDLADGQTDTSIRVWTGLGRDQGQALKMLIDDTFTPEEKIGVDLEIITNMSSMLIPAQLAGTAPDVALGAADMELAFRGALTDLTSFDDYPEVAGRFHKSALTSFTFRGGVYALPETQSFPVLFYRQDILDELGMTVPQTWEEVKKAAADLHRSNLEFGLPATMATMQAMLYQRRIALYKEDGIGTNLDSDEVVDIFTEMTDFFSLYSMPLVYDAANRFKMGEMPLLIADYSLYNTLVVFAPELNGQWSFAQMPGTEEEGGINRATPVTVTGAILLEKSANKEAGWKFLKWWTDEQTQYSFGMELESLMGGAARYQTANKAAMLRLPWGRQERETLEAQWEWCEGTPPVVGGYYASRQFDWLFKAVVIQGEKPRETIPVYNQRIEEEILRKREELGYETDIGQLSDEIKSAYWELYSYVNRS